VDQLKPNLEEVLLWWSGIFYVFLSEIKDVCWANYAFFMADISKNISETTCMMQLLHSRKIIHVTV